MVTKRTKRARALLIPLDDSIIRKGDWSNLMHVILITCDLHHKAPPQKFAFVKW